MSDSLKQGLFPKRTLTGEELADIKALADACEQADGIDLRLVWDALESRAGDKTNDFLYYKDGRLVGFLTLEGLGFDEAEAAGMVDPAYRRQGVFGDLAAVAKAEAQRYHTRVILFVCDRRSLAAKAVCDAIGAQHQFAEHKMALEQGAAPLAAPTELDIHEATVDDAAAVALVLAEDMGADAERFRQKVVSDIRNRSIQYYIANADDQPVGTINVQVLNGQPYIYGFVVRPEYRGRGFGRQILTRVIADIVLDRPQPVFLEVESDNTPALGLYHSTGFTITHTYDYYRLPVTDGVE
jgi:ribosomal protein S18 acetylase RimI-like enzyme